METKMHRRGFLNLLVAGAALAGGRRAEAQLENLLGLGEQLLEQHVDPAVLKALRSGDPTRMSQVLSQLSEELQGDQVVDLASFREVADLALPLLEKSPQTRAYAPWLRARLDYFKVAEKFRAAGPASGTKPAPGGTPPSVPNPTPAQERQAWQAQVSGQAAPRGASTWVPRLKPVLREAGAPPELVWLAEIESSFDPTARSPAGAVGMFQLMGPTARSLGLKLEPRDERLVPESNARAAGKYLRSLHGQFKEWRLALAAYNAGPGRVSDLLKRRRATSFDAIAPSLPAETQMYVPKFEAVLKRREGLTLAALKLPARPRG
jgi:membrane-bound lytic murein transglycosylase D